MVFPPHELVICDPTETTEASLAVGGHCLVRLSETPSTGFRWQYELTEQSVVEYLENRYVPAASGPGAGGKREFLFQGSHSGSVTIRFLLRRPWETGPPHQELELSVSVFSP